MIALRHLLVPTDFSATSDSALRYGKALAGAFEAALHVVHIIEEPYGQPWAVEAYGFSLAALQEEWIKDARGRLAATLTEDERQKLHAVTTTVLGHPVMEILRYANDNAIDLIVMGTHGRGPLGRWCWGASPSASFARRRARS
jgi:nucleotide-binding universal stress UspA family protein